MKKTILLYGLIAGLLVSTFMLVSMNYFSHCDGETNYGLSMIIGYSAMLISFSLVFIGLRQYRNNYLGGYIGFGKAFGLGMLMVFIASTLYVVSWVIDNTFFMPDFMDKYAAHMIKELKDSGASAASIEAKTKEMNDMIVQYKNPLIKTLYTYMEILPVGILAALISAFILKRKAK